jgi:hypothetical protein
MRRTPDTEFGRHPDEVKKMEQLDNCEWCHGLRGGVLGNENIIAGIITCDYCHAEMIFLGLEDGQ